MALPIEYQAMVQSAGPDDLALVANYVRRLSFLDPAGADGFVSMLEGLSVGITRDDRAVPAAVLLPVDLQARVGREGLLEVIVEIERVAEDVVEFSVVHVDFIAEPRPVHPFQLVGNKAEHNDHDNEQNSTRADSRGACAFTPRPLVLENLDHTP